MARISSFSPKCEVGGHVPLLPPIPSPSLSLSFLSSFSTSTLLIIGESVREERLGGSGDMKKGHRCGGGEEDERRSS